MKKTMTAMYCINNEYGENKITCEAIGEYTIKGYDYVIGKIWRDSNGGLWYLWRFSRKYVFVPFTNKDDKYVIHLYN